MLTLGRDVENWNETYGKIGVEIGHIWRCLEFAQDCFLFFRCGRRDYAKCLIPMTSKDDLIEDFLFAKPLRLG